MKSSGDLSDIQKQHFFTDSNLLEDNKIQEIKLSDEFEKSQIKLKYSFVVDWQISE